jgi:Flp pilus assembly pilin Flp
MLIKLRRKSKAQTTAEYAILLGLVIAAVVAMQVYVKRGIQARIHDASKVLVNRTATAGIGGADEFQYEPYYLNSQYTVNRDTDTLATLEPTGNYSANEFSETTRAGQGYTKYGFDVNADANK